MRVGILLTSIIVGSLFFPTALSARPRRSAVGYTSQLPRIDKVELLLFETGEMSIKGILATQTLEGKNAAALASLWRRQVYRFRTPICHYPYFGIKFYRGGKEILYVSVCWDCDNISFMQPSLGFMQGFDGDSKSGKALLEVFRNAFPKP